MKPDGDPIWIERKELLSSGERKAWASYPLRIANLTSPIAGFARTVSKTQLGKLVSADKAKDDKGAAWYQIEVGTADASDNDGWVCEKDHPNTQWQSPLDWPGFEVIGEKAPPIELLSRVLDQLGAAKDPEEAANLKVRADAVDGGALFRTLKQAIDAQGNKDGRVDADELRKALGKPWLAEQIIKLIVQYESEWVGDMAKWDALDSLMLEGEPFWMAEKVRIKKLQWWNKIAGVENFPDNSVVKHVNTFFLTEYFQTKSASSISKLGISFIYHQEALAGVTNRLHWPGGASGVTLCAGYDMKARSAQSIKTDMKNIGLSEEIATKISEASGLHNAAAQTFVSANKDIVNLNEEKQKELLYFTVSQYEEMVRKSITISLTQNQFDALVSFAYNPAARWNSVTEFINAQNIEAAMNKIKEGVKSGGVLMSGLVKRRDDEVTLFISGNYQFHGTSIE